MSAGKNINKKNEITVIEDIKKGRGGVEPNVKGRGAAIDGCLSLRQAKEWEAVLLN